MLGLVFRTGWDLRLAGNPDPEYPRRCPGTGCCCPPAAGSSEPLPGSVEATGNLGETLPTFLSARERPSERPWQRRAESRGMRPQPGRGTRGRPGRLRRGARLACGPPGPPLRSCSSTPGPGPWVSEQAAHQARRPEWPGSKITGPQSQGFYFS